MKRKFRLTYSNTTDFDQILFSTGFEQTLYLIGYFDRPVEVITEEAITDGYGKERTVLMNIQQRMRFDLLEVGDNQRFALKMIAIFDTVSIAFEDEGWTETAVEDLRVEDVENEGYCWNKATFSFRRAIKTLGKCEVDYTIIVPPEA